MARLNHPGIAGVYFIGQDRHVCYMAMELIDGLPLRAVIDRLAASRDAALTIDLALRQAQSEGREAREVRFDQPTPAYPGGGNDPLDGALPGEDGLTSEAKQLSLSRSYLRRCCEVAMEAALALAHTHERGVVHRDVKPENILIDRQGRVRLIDFGVARYFEDGTLTNTGALVGTPLYMSPEQATGRLDLDHRTDVYSLGMVLYELLTLARPIAAPTREGVLRQIVTKAMPPASWQNPAIPRDLEGLLHKAIAKDPDDRYQTAADLAADLRRWLDGGPVAALPYRYRLDRREIKAERPAGVMVLAFAHFLAGTFSAGAASLCIFALVILSNSYVVEHIDKTKVEQISIERVRAGLAVAATRLVLLSAYALPVGFGLLSANRWARRVSVGVSAAIAAWLLFEMIGGLLRGRVGLDFGLRAAIFALDGSMIAYLLRRSTRDWFLLAARVRAEHGHSSGVPGGRGGKS